MRNLVFKGENNQALTNSLLVAEKFGKEHQHVLRDIRNLVEGVSKIGDTPMFVESSYIHSQNGQEYPLFIMNRDGFTLLAMGFTGDKALQFKLDYINAFNKMEEAIKSGGFQVPSSFSEALMLAAEQQKQIEMQQNLLSAQAPKVLFADAVVASENSILIGRLANVLKQNGIEIGQNRLFKWLRDNGYLCKCGEKYNQPTQMAMELELFEVSYGSIVRADKSINTITTKVTGKGQIYFINKFLKK